jgi:hypothetical protein
MEILIQDVLSYPRKISFHNQKDIVSHPPRSLFVASKLNSESSGAGSVGSHACQCLMLTTHESEVPHNGERGAVRRCSDRVGFHLLLLASAGHRRPLQEEVELTDGCSGTIVTWTTGWLRFSAQKSALKL